MQNILDNPKKTNKKKQVKYGLIDAVNLEILSLKSFRKTITLKYMEHTMKENLLLLKNLLILYKRRFPSIWQLFQEMFILMF